MQRKIDEYWRRKKSSKGTLSAVTSKVQITMSDIGAQAIAKSVNPNQRNKNKLIPFYFNKLVQLVIHSYGMNNILRIFNAKTAGCIECC